MTRIKEILKKYSLKDAKAWEDTIAMLLNKGIPNGCYQDYAMLMDVISILTISQDLVEKGDNDE